jgi:DNA-binding beta-propeller fold protein YncE
LAIDETRHKVYVSHLAFLNPEFAVIDVATDEITLIDNVDGARAFGSVSVNEITNKIYVIRTHSGDMVEIDGDTLSVSSPFVFDFPQPVQSGINHQENKLYIKTIGGPEGRPTVCIQDRNQASPKCTNIAGNDWGGIVTNEMTNKVYLGVEVGDRIGILDGNTNNLTEIFVESATGSSGYTNQSHDIIVNENTNHIFFVNEGFLLALDGETQQFRKIVYADVGLPGGGLLLSAIAINRVTDQLYVVNDGTRVNKVAVFQDR